jgi:hypothetical protein
MTVGFFLLKKRKEWHDATGYEMKERNDWGESRRLGRRDVLRGPENGTKTYLSHLVAWEV